MSPSRKSSVSSASSESAENECFNFVVEKLHRLQPVSLHALAGHLSSLPRHLQTVTGTSAQDVKRFLKNYPEAFDINEKGRVSLLKHPQDLQNGNRSCNNYRANIFNCRGQITRLFPMYGFMKCESPVEASVYFSSDCFGDSRKKPLQDYCLYMGQTLAFDAKLGSAEASAEYQATRVWFVSSEDGYNDEDNNAGDRYKKNSRYNTKKSDLSSFPPKQFKNRSMNQNKQNVGHIQRKNPSSTSGNGKRSVGYIQNIFNQYGFIEEKKRGGNTVFFHKNSIRSRRKINNLTNVLQKGDEVQFISVHSSVKPNYLEATHVWLNGESSAPSSEEENLYASSTEFSGDEKRNFEETAGKYNMASPLDKNASSLLNYVGKICLASKAIPEIMFGESYDSIAIADEHYCNFYVENEKVDDLNWEFHDGDQVFFDAVRAEKDDGSRFWKAVLVWTGKKPDEEINLPVSSETDEENYGAENSQNCEGYTEQDGSCSWSEEEKGSGHAEYADWGSSPFIDDCFGKDISEEKPAEDAVERKDDHFCASGRPLSISGSTKVEKNKVLVLAHRDDEDFQNDSHSRIMQDMGSREDDLLCSGTSAGIYSEEEQQQADKSETEIRLSTPGVYMFENLIGSVLKLSGYFFSLSCKDLERPVPVNCSILYHDGKLIRDKCTDLKELVKEGNTVCFNCFVIIDDVGEYWQKVTSAWIGSRPSDLKDSNPIDFIEKENLKVSCEVPSWKQFRKNKSKNVKSTPAINNQVTNVVPLSVIKPSSTQTSKKISSGRKFLSAVYDDQHANCDESLENEAVLLEERKLDQVAGLVPESLVNQFDEILRSLEKMKHTHASSSQQDIDSLSSNIEAAVNTVLTHLQMNVPHSKGVNKSCQTGPFPAAEAEMRRSLKVPPPTSAATTQTLITGHVISANLFPF